MTTAKRALIVDDSRSARVILSRMLEQHGLTVDTAESAEQALEYLQRTRPDVIFMDHLMPGMDGFQAVQTIKADALTATIPLMMYTSQEGELYVSQARALGAVGVLPKTVRPVDVSRVLYQLHLLPDRRAMRTALFPGPAAAAAQAARSGFGTEASMAAALAADAPESPAGIESETTGIRRGSRVRHALRRARPGPDAGAAVGAAARPAGVDAPDGQGPAGRAAPVHARDVRSVCPPADRRGEGGDCAGPGPAGRAGPGPAGGAKAVVARGHHGVAGGDTGGCPRLHHLAGCEHEPLAGARPRRCTSLARARPGRGRGRRNGRQGGFGRRNGRQHRLARPSRRVRPRARR